MNDIPLIPIIVIGLFWAISLFSILKPDIVVNLTLKYFKWTMKLYGFEGEIGPH